MITVGEVKMAITKVIQRKREKNRVESNMGHKPKFLLVAAFKDIHKQIKTMHGKNDVPPSELESALKELIVSDWLRPACGAFVPKKQLLGESEKITEYWSKPIQ